MTELRMEGKNETLLGKIAGVLSGEVPGIKRTVLEDWVLEQPSEQADLTEETQKNFWDEEIKQIWVTENRGGQQVRTLASVIDNYRYIFIHDESLKNIRGLNLLNGRITFSGPVPWDKTKRPGEFWTDFDDSGLKNFIQRRYGKYGLKVNDYLRDALLIETKKNAYHPIVDYLEGLQWDGKKRLDKILVHYFGAEDTTYNRTVTRKTLVAAVKRAYEPGCKFDNVLVLISEKQGIGKSSFLRRLCKDSTWFSDSMTCWEGTKAYEQLVSKWIIEIPENSVSSKTDVNASKAFISKQADSFRPAYGRNLEEHPRQCIFIITANDRNILRDETGNRRYWPVDLMQQPQEEDPRYDITDEDIDQIWAEAVAAYKAGEELWLTRDEEKMAEEAQAEHAEDDSRIGMIEGYLERLIPVKWGTYTREQRIKFYKSIDESLVGDPEWMERDRVCAAEILCECFDNEKYKPYEAAAINKIMDHMPGWKRYKNPRRFGIYGNQRGFYKVGSTADPDSGKTTWNI